MQHMSAPRLMEPLLTCQVSSIPPNTRGQNLILVGTALTMQLLGRACTHAIPGKGADLAFQCAAELLQDGRMSRAADVYSFAMIMWELFACKRLYEGHIASQVRFCTLTLMQT